MAIIKEEYKDFSWDLHAKPVHKPLVAQMELTYRCPLHCKHCYTDCYNRHSYTKNELSTKEVKFILDKCKNAGVVWLCFTGGDPMLRKDFIELYLYAVGLGFIATVFTSLITMNNGILRTFKKSPPFNIETTLNAATPAKYREITGTSFFRKHVSNIKKLIKHNIPVRVKTQVTKQNIVQIGRIQRLVESWGLDFRPSTMIYARLNKDTYPCQLRLDPKDAVRINKKYGYFEEADVRKPKERIKLKNLTGRLDHNKVFSCVAGGHIFWISPDGKMSVCETFKKPYYNLLKKSGTVANGFHEIHRKVHAIKFKTKSRCRNCEYRLICKWCPARAYLETGSREKPIEYFCKLTDETIKGCQSR